MANPGNGYRTANDVLTEVSLHLVCPYVNTVLTGAVGTGLQTVGVASLGLPVNSIYVGAMIIVGAGAAREIVVVTATSPPPNPTITAVFANPHVPGDPVIGATFPLQAETDPIFTQQEMLGYLARAQNEFLQAIPCIYAVFKQTAIIGQIVQVTPGTSVELNRVACSQIANPITTLTRLGGLVTATFVDPHLQKVNNTFWVSEPADPTFEGVFQVASVPDPNTITYLQNSPNATTTGGYIAYYVRMYETTQEQLNLVNRQWQATPGLPTSWFEDRTGLYRWGLSPKPYVETPLELLCSIRDTDTLGLLDGFAVPDCVLPYIKYRCLEYAFSKDGVFHDGERAAYCGERYKRGVLTVARFIDNMLAMEAKG